MLKAFAPLFLLCRDYNNVYDAMPGVPITGAQNAEYVRFSRSSLASARKKLEEFLSLMPADAMAQARSQIEAAGASE